VNVVSADIEYSGPKDREVHRHNELQKNPQGGRCENDVAPGGEKGYANNWLKTKQRPERPDSRFCGAK